MYLLTESSKLMVRILLLLTEVPRQPNLYVQYLFTYFMAVTEIEDKHQYFNLTYILCLPYRNLIIHKKFVILSNSLKI